MSDMEAKLAQLGATVASGFAEVRAGMALHERRQQERHVENTDRLDKINGRVNDAHSKTDELGGVVQSLSARVEVVHSNYHNLRNWIQEKIGRVMPPIKEASTSCDGQPVSRAELKWVIGLIVACITIGAGVTIWIMKIAGKL